MKKLISLSFLLSGLSISSWGVAQDTFDGSRIKATFEIWRGQSPGAGGSIIGVDDEATGVVSDETAPDFKGFNSRYDDYELWDIDFSSRQITLTYTSIYKQDFDHQYMYTNSKGFHFEDIDNKLNDIIGVSLDSSSELFGFSPARISFDANNIYIDMKGSMCHIAGMASMPNCANSQSSTGTGYDNQLKLNVEFAGSTRSSDPIPVSGWANQAVSGLWWNPKKAGQGYSVHQIGNQMAVVWYTYKEDNTPIWYLASGLKNDDSWQAELKQYQWDGVRAAATSVGTVSIQFNSAESGTLNWQLAGKTGQETINLFQLSPGAAIDSERTGLMFDPNQPGWGWSVIRQGNVEASALYFYGQDGQPRWALGNNGGVANANNYALSTYQGTCPSCDFVAATPSPAGSMSRQFNSPSTATLTTDITLPQPLSGIWLIQGAEVSKADQ